MATIEIIREEDQQTERRRAVEERLAKAREEYKIGVLSVAKTGRVAEREWTQLLRVALQLEKQPREVVADVELVREASHWRRLQEDLPTIRQEASRAAKLHFAFEAKTAYLVALIQGEIEGQRATGEPDCAEVERLRLSIDELRTHREPEARTLRKSHERAKSLASQAMGAKGKLDKLQREFGIH